MKNNYEIRGATAVIFINGGGHKNKEVLIDLCDLPKLLVYPNSWYILSVADIYYARSAITINGKIVQLLMHRFLLNPNSNLEVDHINHNGLDNRRNNLRLVTHAENQQNKKGPQISNITGGVRGVSWDKNRGMWKAQVEINKKKVFCKRFISKNDAINAVKDARSKVMKYSN